MGGTHEGALVEQRRNKAIEMYRNGSKDFQIQMELGISKMKLDAILEGWPVREKRTYPKGVTRDRYKNGWGVVAISLLASGMSIVEVFRKMSSDGMPLTLSYIGRLSIRSRGLVTNRIELEDIFTMFDIVKSCRGMSREDLCCRFKAATDKNIGLSTASYWVRKIRNLTPEQECAYFESVYKRIRLRDGAKAKRDAHLRAITERKAGLLERKEAEKQRIAEWYAHKESKAMRDKGRITKKPIAAGSQSPENNEKQEIIIQYAQKQPDILKMKW